MNKDELRRRFKDQVLQKNTKIECKTPNRRIEVTHNSEDESCIQEGSLENHTIESDLTQSQQYTKLDTAPISELDTAPITETLLEKAKKGDVVSMLELGKSYFRGKNGYPRSYKDAALWYLQAAKEGSAEAQYRLGRCYEDGKGVKQSNKDAMMWFELAGKQNYPHATERLEKLRLIEDIIQNSSRKFSTTNTPSETNLVSCEDADVSYENTLFTEDSRNKLSVEEKIKDNILPFFTAPVITMLFNFCFLFKVSNANSVVGFWESIGSTLNILLFMVGAPIFVALGTWWLYNGVFSDKKYMDFDLGYWGYLFKLYGYVLLLSAISQWWLVLLIVGIELLVRYNNTKQGVYRYY